MPRYVPAQMGTSIKLRGGFAASRAGAGMKPRSPLPAYGQAWQSAGGTHQQGRWYYVGAICVAHVGEHARSGWVALVDRHLGETGWSSAIAPDRATAMRWVETWARREDVRLTREVARMRIGPDGFAEFVEPPTED